METNYRFAKDGKLLVNVIFKSKQIFIEKAKCFFN